MKKRDRESVSDKDKGNDVGARAMSEKISGKPILSV